jgi:hypothetical protein
MAILRRISGPGLGIGSAATGLALHRPLSGAARLYVAAAASDQLIVLLTTFDNSLSTPAALYARMEK